MSQTTARGNNTVKWAIVGQATCDVTSTKKQLHSGQREKMLVHNAQNVLHHFTSVVSLNITRINNVLFLIYAKQFTLKACICCTSL
jgi:hypothetical protein